jgi:hypothetical protein
MGFLKSSACSLAARLALAGVATIGGIMILRSYRQRAARTRRSQLRLPGCLSELISTPSAGSERDGILPLSSYEYWRGGQPKRRSVRFADADFFSDCFGDVLSSYIDVLSNIQFACLHRAFSGDACRSHSGSGHGRWRSRRRVAAGQHCPSATRCGVPERLQDRAYH